MKESGEPLFWLLWAAFGITLGVAGFIMGIVLDKPAEEIAIFIFPFIIGIVAAAAALQSMEN